LPLAHYIARIFVETQTDQARMPQVIVRRPLHELELPKKHKLKPAAFGVISVQSSTVTVNKIDKLRQMVVGPAKRRRRG
jgi:hypothetical protein